MHRFRLLFFLFAASAFASTAGTQQNEMIIPHLSFHFGVSQNLPGDRLLPRVARRIVFSLDNTKIISKLVDGSVEQWDLGTREEEHITTTKDLFAYSLSRNLLLVKKENDDVALIALDTDEEIILTNGAFENASLSANGEFAVLSRGNKQIEIWDIDQKRLLKHLKHG